MKEESDFMDQENSFGETLFGFDDICSGPVESISDTEFNEMGGMSLISTGIKGGDFRCGGKASIQFFGDSFRPKVSVIYTNGDSETLIEHIPLTREIACLSISVIGDWELQGFVANILNIANQLLSKSKNNRENDIEEKTYAIFEAIEPALKQAIVEALK